MEAAAAPEDQAYDPRILVFSTNNISDPGIDLAGCSHMHYSPNVTVISLPCTSGIKPSWILYAVEQLFGAAAIQASSQVASESPRGLLRRRACRAAARRALRYRAPARI